jgi:hypothetical protein
LLPDDQLLYIIALLRNTPVQPPALSTDGWQRFFTCLGLHGVFALIAYHLRPWPGDCRPPKEITDILDRHFLAASAKSLLAGRQIQTAADALEAASIPYALLKGPALARTVYPHAALRQSNDVDLLVRRDDVIAAEAVLYDLGYLSPHREFHTRPHAYHQEFSPPPGNGIPLELHWSLDCGYRLGPDGWADNAIGRRISFESADLHAHTLSQVDHLLYLGLHHGFQHVGLRLDQIADISGLVTGTPNPTEWNGIVSRAKTSRLLLPLRFAVEASSLWAGTEPPGGYDELDAWPRASGRERRLWGHMRTRSNSLSSSLRIRGHSERGIVNKAHFVCRMVLPPHGKLEQYRRSDSAIDIPLAHFRRWLSITRNR